MYFVEQDESYGRLFLACYVFHMRLILIYMLLSASASGNGTVSPFKFQSPISLKAGKNEIALLSMTVGLQVSYYSLLSLLQFAMY